jgi:hypothetical protein
VPIGQCQTLGHQPLIDVNLADEAAADDALVAVDVARVAADRAAPDQILKRERGPLAAAPRAALRIEAGLAALGASMPWSLMR